MKRLFVVPICLLAAACSGAEVKDTPPDPDPPVHEGPKVKVGVLEFTAGEDVGASEDALSTFADRFCRGMEARGDISCMSPADRASFLKATAFQMAVGGCDDCSETIEALGDVAYYVETRLEKAEDGLVLTTTLIRREERVKLQTLDGTATGLEDLLDVSVELGQKLGTAIP